MFRLTVTQIEDILVDHEKIAIAGPPRCGKTLLAEGFYGYTEEPWLLLPADLLMHKTWEETPHVIIDVLHHFERYIVEGVQVGRALRKGLKPDIVIYLSHPHVEMSKGQITMAKGCETIFSDWVSTDHGVTVLGWEERTRASTLAAMALHNSD